jgi:hypothetical protein
MLPLPMLLSAYGLTLVASKVKNLFVFPTYFLLLGALLINYLFMLKSYVVDYSWVWQYGYRQMVEFVKQNYDGYDKIIITKKYGEPHEFVLFNWPWDPASYRSDPNLVRYFKSDWYWVDSFAKFKFVNDWEMPQRVSQLFPGHKYLVVSSPENPTPGELVDQINFLDTKPAFIIKKLIL